MTWGTACQWKPRESLGEVKVGTKSQRRDRELAERKAAKSLSAAACCQFESRSRATACHC